MDKDYWLNRDIWSQSEFQDLCCGLVPGEYRSTETIIMVNKVREDINRAVLIKKLSFKEHSDVSSEDRMYDHHRFFVPKDVIPWASKNFETFPFSIDDINCIQVSEKRFDTRERDNMLRLIYALAIKAGYPLENPHPDSEAIKDYAVNKGFNLPESKTIASKLDEARRLHKEET